MSNTEEDEQLQVRLQHLYLTEVRPNGKDIGNGAYGRVFEVECYGNVYAAKEIHSILMQGVGREEMQKYFLTSVFKAWLSDIQILSRF